jgi:cyanophycin synthetase
MKILSIQALRGPNYWSVSRPKLIQMRLDLEEMEELPSNKIPGFSKRLQEFLPSLFTHRCSPGHEGGFFERVEEGTWMGHIIEHVALEIQTLAGMDTGFGRTRSTKEHGVYNVVFSYIEEQVGLYAAEASVKLIQALIDETQDKYDLDGDVMKMRELREQQRFGPSTGSIVQEAVNRDIPFLRLNKSSLVQLGYGKNQLRFRATMTDKTSSIAVDLACDKRQTKNILEGAEVAVAKGEIINSIDDLDWVIKKVGYPLVFKPIDGNHGKGATINVLTREDAIEAFNYAKQWSRWVIVESFIEGFDFRILVIDNKVVAAAQRVPAHVVGNGKDSIEKLVEEVNKDPRRGFGHEEVLTEIDLNHHSLELLKKAGYTTKTVLPKGEIFYLKKTANLSTGGTSVDITDSLHPYNIFIAERISRIIGLDICGIDIMASDLSNPISENGGVVLEVNAAPGFRMHLAPSEGLPRNVAQPVIDMLFPPGKPSRIPIIAITGTNGKTTTTRLMAHMIKNAGYRVGFTTSDGIYVQNSMLSKGDTTGPSSAEFILKDPTVEYAVLETARGGILRRGLGFKKCDVGIITNIQEDHLGLKDIHTLKDLARVKAVVVRSVKRDGHAVLNADDKSCVDIAKELDCNIAYFSMDENNPVLKKHCKAGGIGAVYENGYVTILRGDWKIRVEKVTTIPLTFGGKAAFQIQNCLAATLAGYLSNIRIETLRLSLETFTPSAAQTPGRMNIFEFNKFKYMIDFAHNTSGFLAIKDFLSKIDSPNKIGIIAGTGDRRDIDLIECGKLAAEMFDHIIIRQERHLRGRTEAEIVGFLIKGIKKANPNASYEVIPLELDAIRHSLDLATEGAFITCLSDAISNAIDVVQSYMDVESGLSFDLSNDELSTKERANRREQINKRTAEVNLIIPKDDVDAKLEQSKTED